MIWDNETTETLRTLWDQGHSAAEIGRRMGFSKNAIVGRAHRLNLSERPSPIRRGVTPQRQITRRPLASGRVTLPALSSAPAVRKLPEPKKLSPEDDALVKVLSANGMGYNAICDKTGISNYFVRRALGYRWPDQAPRVVESVAPLVMATKPVFAAPIVLAEVAPIYHPVAGQCLWLHGSRPYVQCTEMALAGEGVARPWSYCGCHRADAYVRRAA